MNTEGLSHGDIEELKKEAGIMSAISAHPNVVFVYLNIFHEKLGLLGIIEEPVLTIITELCENGSLKDYITKNPPFSPKALRGMLLGIAKGTFFKD